MNNPFTVETGIRYERRITDPAIYYKAAIALLSIVTLIHALSWPVVTSGSRFAFLSTVAAGFGGAVLTGAIVRRVAGNTAGALALLILTFYPMLICNEHSLLSQTKVFFFLGLLVWLLMVYRTRILSTVLAAAIAFGYLGQLIHTQSDLVRRNAAHPGHYIAEVASTIVYFFGVPYHGLTEGSICSNQLVSYFNPLYTWLVRFSCILSAWWLLNSAKEREAGGVIMAGIPFAFLFLQALMMMSGGRYAFPAYPLLIGNSITILSLVVRAWNNKRIVNTL